MVHLELQISSWLTDLDLIVLGSSPTGCDPTGACIDASINYNPETVTFTAAANTPYFVVIDGYNGDSGSYTLWVDCE